MVPIFRRGIDAPFEDFLFRAGFTTRPTAQQRRMLRQSPLRSDVSGSRLRVAKASGSMHVSSWLSLSLPNATSRGPTSSSRMNALRLAEVGTSTVSSSSCSDETPGGIANPHCNSSRRRSFASEDMDIVSILHYNDMNGKSMPVFAFAMHRQAGPRFSLS
ncbi:MAG: hypothetical protein KGI60_02435 [Patescibacteria group bacterium]|nr:hypothetical protein [Patescibacteria group bacterium]